MQNKIYVLVGILVLGVIIFFGIRNANNLKKTETKTEVASTTASTSSPIVALPKEPTETSQSIEKSSWAVFQKYLSFAKNHDFPSLKSVSYQNSDTCNDPTKTKECNDLMDFAYKNGAQFVEKDFTNVWFDHKQIILSTDFHTEQSDMTRSFVRKVIYLVRDSKGTPKILSLTVPDEVTYTIIDKNQPMATSTVDARLEFRTKDSDKDGLPDEVETCSYQGAPSDCIKTNPNKRDSLGDGWWDGIRILLKKS